MPLTGIFFTAGVVGVVGQLPPLSATRQQHLLLYPNSPYPKLQAANGSTITIRQGTPDSFLRAIDEVREGRMGFCKAGRLYGVSHATLQKYYKAMGYVLRNQTNNPNFRKRPDGIPLEPRRRYYSVPTAHSDMPYLPNNRMLFPHIIANPCSSNYHVQNVNLKNPPTEEVNQQLQDSFKVKDMFQEVGEPLKSKNVGPVMKDPFDREITDTPYND